MIDMNETKLTTLEQIRGFLSGTAEVGFRIAEKGEDERYRHISAVLTRFGYKGLAKPDRGLILRYLERTTGYSRQQLTRLVKRWHEGRGLRKHYRIPKHGWVRKFSAADIALLAETDMSVTEVAVACGYASSSHFSKSFRKKYGVSPYRFSHFGA